MPQGNAGLGELAVRKQLLIAESEINRMLLKEEAAALAGELRDLSRKATQLRGILGMATAAFSAARPKPTEPATGKRSWFAPVLSGLRLGTSLWAKFRERKGRH